MTFHAASNASIRRGARARRRLASAGFTMVELTVALMAGLIVAMGIVGLSRDATNTFHDEARASVAEASLRAAMDRLRGDLQRAGYMSTSNFLNDPNVATAPGATPDANIANTLTGIVNLQSIEIDPLAPAPPLSTVNGIDSDAILVSGNMTTADQFDVAYVNQASNGGCTRIYLSATSPAMYRLIGTGGNVADLTAAFQPATGRQFVVRLVDDTGKSQFLVTCTSDTAAGLDSTVNLPFVSVDTSSAGAALKTAKSTGTAAALTGPAAGRAWVNPVNTVRWELMTNAQELANGIPQYTNGLQTQTASGGTDTTKYDLVRTLCDAKQAPVYGTSEVIAEYAVDLKLAVSIAGSAAQAPDPQATSSTITSYAFPDAANRSIAKVIGRPGGGGGIPQRIRSLRARLVVRAGQADRTATLGVMPSYGNDGFMYRYCVLPGGCTSNGSTVQYARARTLTTEVALPNQSKVFY